MQIADEDLVDFRMFFKKHREKFELYSYAKAFGIGFLISRGFNWEAADLAIKKELISLWSN
jgi:hypothetical protein